jgi:hypothetical protein
MFWIISPYHNNDFDEAIFPADTDEHHHIALGYAKGRLEALWDQAEVGKKITVTMELREGDPLELFPSLDPEREE